MGGVGSEGGGERGRGGVGVRLKAGCGRRYGDLATCVEYCGENYAEMKIEI